MEWLALLLAGTVAGLVAGLFGVGGGIIIVPVLALLYEAQAIDPQVLIKVAVGTSLATIVFTAVTSTLAHHRRGAVDWAVFRQIVPGILIGALIGAWIVDRISGPLLFLLFVVFLYAVAIRMALPKVTAHRGLPGAAGMAATGTGIGLVSALMGIGGGTMSVPFLSYCSVPIKRAIGTAAAIGFPIAAASTLAFVVAGQNEPGLPAGSLGYVHLPAMATIVLASFVFAPLGARLAHALPDSVLKRAFAVFLLILATRMAWSVIHS